MKKEVNPNVLQALKKEYEGYLNDDQIIEAAKEVTQVMEEILDLVQVKLKTKNPVYCGHAVDFAHQLIHSFIGEFAEKIKAQNNSKKQH